MFFICAILASVCVRVCVCNLVFFVHPELAGLRGGRGILGEQNVPVGHDRDKISVPTGKPTRKGILGKRDPLVLRGNQKGPFRFPQTKASSPRHPSCTSVLIPQPANSFKDISFVTCLLKKERWNLMLNHFHHYGIWLGDLANPFKATGNAVSLFSFLVFSLINGAGWPLASQPFPHQRFPLFLT